MRVTAREPGRLTIALLAWLSISHSPGWALVEPFDVREASIDNIHTALFTGMATCRDIVSSFISRIEKFNPIINAIISLNTESLFLADQIDLQIAAGNTTGALLCIP
jgi:hypothetical protein